MGILDTQLSSALGLKGEKPGMTAGALSTSSTHVLDPTPGLKGDEIISFDSVFDLDGQTPVKYWDIKPN